MPATKGSRISRSTHSTSTPSTSVTTQNVIWRVSVILVPRAQLERASARRSLVSRDRAHVADPFAQIDRDRGQREGGDRRHGRGECPSGVEAEAERGEHQSDQEKLRRG